MTLVTARHALQRLCLSILQHASCQYCQSTGTVHAEVPQSILQHQIESLQCVLIARLLPQHPAASFAVLQTFQVCDPCWSVAEVPGSHSNVIQRREGLGEHQESAKELLKQVIATMFTSI